ncbi:MAG: NAD-dependent epimerase/dehydratase family protein [Alsobacter sp.]
MSLLLVTGGSGMVAQHVAEVAAARGFRVRLGDIAWTPGRNRAAAAETVTFDIRDAGACRAHAAGVRAVVHCAAVVGPVRARVDPLATLAVNVTGTANLLQAAHEAGARFVNVSTATLYGHRPDLGPLPEDAATDPLSVYDGTKLMTETYCATHRRTYGSVAASVRTGFVFGLGSQIGEYFLPRVLAGEAVSEPAGSDHSCDFTYVVDLAEALVAAVEAPSLPETVYNVTGGVLRTRGELARAVRDLVPGARIDIGPGVDPARHLRGACTLERARRDLSWSPRFTLEAGLADWRRRLEDRA